MPSKGSEISEAGGRAGPAHAHAASRRGLRRVWALGPAEKACGWSLDSGGEHAAEWTDVIFTLTHLKFI